jgi:hypothetical protein
MLALWIGSMVIFMRGLESRMKAEDSILPVDPNDARSGVRDAVQRISLDSPPGAWEELRAARLENKPRMVTQRLLE